MNTARAKEQVTAPGKFDGVEDHRRKNFSRKHKKPGGHAGKGKFKKHKRHMKRY